MNLLLEDKIEIFKVYDLVYSEVDNYLWEGGYGAMLDKLLLNQLEQIYDLFYGNYLGA